MYTVNIPEWRHEWQRVMCLMVRHGVLRHRSISSPVTLPHATTTSRWHGCDGKVL